MPTTSHFRIECFDVMEHQKISVETEDKKKSIENYEYIGEMVTIIMQFIPNADSCPVFETSNEQWEFIYNVLVYLNQYSEIPFLTDTNIKDIGVHDCFSFSSRKAVFISNILEASYQSNLLQNYVKEFESYNLSYVDKMNIIDELCHYLQMSGGFYLKITDMVVHS